MNTQTSQDSVLCNATTLHWTNIDASITYSEKHSNNARLLSRDLEFVTVAPIPPPPTPAKPSIMTNHVGTAISGGVILNVQETNNVTDSMLLQLETLDACLMQTSDTGMLHYHSYSGCVQTKGVTKPALCVDTPGCTENVVQYLLSTQKNSNNYGGIFGIARDGHVIYGPYNEKGEVWSCDDHDVCNGFFLPDGSYGYASTTFFPYTVGCWGPGPS